MVGNPVVPAVAPSARNQAEHGGDRWPWRTHTFCKAQHRVGFDKDATTVEHNHRFGIGSRHVKFLQQGLPGLSLHGTKAQISASRALEDERHGAAAKIADAVE
jgi:hypothetical protein